jgi:hypothetical protein
MKDPRIALVLSAKTLLPVLLVIAGLSLAPGQNAQSSGSANSGQSNTATTRTNNPDGSTTVTTTTTYKDGSVTTETTYDKDGHDAGTVRTDIQTKDGDTTTTITKYDGNGHEIGKTVTRVDKDGNTTVTHYDGNGNPTNTSSLPPFKWKPDWKIGLDHKVPPELRYLRVPKSETQTAPGPTGATRVTNTDGVTTVTTVTIFNDGWIITITKYDKDGHDAGTTRTDVQTKDGQTTTTTTRWDGNGHETGKTVEEAKADGAKTTITYDGNGHETGRATVPKSEAQNQSSPRPKAKLQGLTPDDEKNIQKALNPEQSSGKTSGQTLGGAPSQNASGPWPPPPAKCPPCESYWTEMMELTKGHPGAMDTKVYVECVEKYCPKQETQHNTKPDQNQQSNTCPSGTGCTPCNPGEACESGLSNCPLGMHCSTQTSGGQQPAKPQGLTPEDEKRIQKALNPDETTNRASGRSGGAEHPPGHPDLPMLPCPQCADAWKQVLDYAQLESGDRDGRYAGAGRHFYEIYLQCVQKYCPELTTQLQTNTCPAGKCENPPTSTCPSGTRCSPCEPGAKCENPGVSNCPAGMHCTPCEPGQKCENQALTSAGQESPLADPSLTIEDKIALMIMKMMKDLDEKIKRQSQQQNQQTSPSPAMTESIVGIVTPAHRQKDKPFSGSLTTDPKQYQGIPGLHVQEVKVPLLVGGDGKPTLQGLRVDTGNGIFQKLGLPTSNSSYFFVPLTPGTRPHLVATSTFSSTGDTGSGLPGTATQNGAGTNTSRTVGQPAQGTTTGQIPAGSQATISQQGDQITIQPGPPPDGVPQPSVISFQPLGNPPVSVTLDVPGDWGMPQPYDETVQPINAQNPALFTPASGHQGLLGQTLTDPVCMPGHITAVHGAGQFSGDSYKLHVSFGGHPVDPIAASTDGFFFQVPASAQEGPAQLVFADQGPQGWFAASATIGVLQLHTGIANPNLHRGLHTTGTVGLSGGGYTGFKSPANQPGHEPFKISPGLSQYNKNVFYDPDLVSLTDIQKQVPDFHPPETGQPGFIFLSILNRTPNIISIDGFKGNIRSWYVPADSLPFNTQLGIKAIADGGFDIGIIAQPLFPLLPAQVYQLPPNVARELEDASRCGFSGPC